MKTNGIVTVIIIVSVAIGIVFFLPVRPPQFRIINHPAPGTDREGYTGEAVYTLMADYFSAIGSRADFAVHAGSYHRMSPGTERGIRWPLASLTKQFTGYMIASLVRRGKLAWTDKLGERVNTFSGTGMGKVTIDSLCRHRSGIDAPTFTGYWDMTFFDREDHSAGFLEHGMMYCRMNGSESLYSDYNYTLLRLVIDTVENYDDLFHHEIHDGLGLAETILELRNGTQPVRIRGYYSLSSLGRPYSPVCIPMPSWNISMLKGAVGVASSVSDLYRWYVHLRGIFMSKDARDAWYFPTEDGSYRNGWIRTQGNDGSAIFHHGGLVPGFASFILMDFERDVFVVYICDVSVWKSNYNIDAEIINIIKGAPYRSGSLDYPCGP